MKTLKEFKDEYAQQHLQYESWEGFQNYTEPEAYNDALKRVNHLYEKHQALDPGTSPEEEMLFDKAISIVVDRIKHTRKTTPILGEIRPKNLPIETAAKEIQKHFLTWLGKEIEDLTIEELLVLQLWAQGLLPILSNALLVELRENDYI